MPSIVPKYEYDIFISYRQNDNQEGWVTRFVESLQQELKSLFKEEISVYFDSDPNHGLHETHDVDGSLKEKVKCLIFIPIVSQTYCDPKAFAWQKEFLPFLEFAKQDEFGLEVKVSGGNVSKRVLPVRIHELDSEDQKLFEEQIGGVMRPVDFIYKEAGVNRPLIPSDYKNDNQNKTDYRNQVNKVANSIKQILYSLKDPFISKETHKVSPTPGSLPIRKPFKVLLPLLLLALAVVSFIFYMSSEKPTPEAKDRSLVVLPFSSLSGNADDEFFSDGLTEDIIDLLVKMDVLDVTSKTSSMKYKNSDKTIPEISSELGVRYALEGSVRKDSSSIKVVAQLIESQSDIHVWSITIEKPLKSLIELQTEISEDIQRYMARTIQSSEGDEHFRVITQNFQAFERFEEALQITRSRVPPLENINKAIDLLKEAIEMDQRFAYAYLELAYQYGDKYDRGYGKIYGDSAIFFVKRSERYGPYDADFYNALGFAVDGWEDRISYFKKANELDPTKSLVPIGTYYAYARSRPDSAYAYFLKELQYSPNWDFVHMRLGLLWSFLGNNDSANYYYERAAYLADEDLVDLKFHYVNHYLRNKKYDEGIFYIHNQILNQKTPEIVDRGYSLLAGTYALKNQFDSTYSILNRNLRYKESTLMALSMKKLGKSELYNSLIAKLKSIHLDSSKKPNFLTVENEITKIELLILEDQIEQAIITSEAINDYRFFRYFLNTPFFEEVSDHPRIQKRLTAMESRNQEMIQRIVNRVVVID